MSASNWVFDKWEFDQDEEVTLYWLRSPYLDSNGHWKIDIIFRRRDGDFKTIESISWGCLPVVRLWSVYKNGRYLRQELSNKTNLSFSPNVKPTTKTAGCISSGLYSLNKDGLNLSELCLLIRQDNKEIIIPCMEIIRFFFALNKTLAYEILTPTPFTVDVVESKKLQGDCLDIYFYSNIALKALSANIIQKIALMIEDDKWSTSLKAILTKRSGTHSKNANPNIPLECIPPVLQDSQWRVRSIERGNQILVLEIIGIQTQKTYPFSEIRAFHTNKSNITTSNVPEEASESPVTGVPLPTYIVKSDESGPRNVTQPAILRTAISSLGIKFSTKPTFSWLVKKDKDISPIIKKRNKQKTAKEVTLNDAIGAGEVQSAEFGFYEYGKEILADEYIDYVSELNLMPLDTDNIPEEFSEFLSAVMAIQVSQGVNSFYKTGEISKKQYALVYLIIGEQSIFLLELDRSVQKSSTLLFRVLDPFAVVQIIENLIKNYNDSRNWNREHLEEYVKLSSEIKISFAIHKKNDTSEAWGNRLVNKISELMRPNKLDKGY